MQVVIPANTQTQPYSVVTPETSLQAGGVLTPLADSTIPAAKSSGLAAATEHAVDSKPMSPSDALMYQARTLSCTAVLCPPQVPLCTEHTRLRLLPSLPCRLLHSLGLPADVTPEKQRPSQP